MKIIQLNYDDLFTIHFATINTLFGGKIKELLLKFTIHFATINTLILKEM